MLKIVNNKPSKKMDEEIEVEEIESEVENENEEEEELEEDDEFENVINMGCNFIHLITGEQIICTLLVDEDTPSLFYCDNPMRVVQELDEDDVIQTRLLMFNPFLKNNLIIVNVDHIVYYGEGSDEITENYNEFIEFIHEKEEEEKQKENIVLDKVGNVTFGNFKRINPKEFQEIKE